MWKIRAHYNSWRSKLGLQHVICNSTSALTYLVLLKHLLFKQPQGQRKDMFIVLGTSVPVLQGLRANKVALIRWYWGLQALNCPPSRLFLYRQVDFLALMSLCIQAPFVHSCVLGEGVSVVRQYLKIHSFLIFVMERRSYWRNIAHDRFQ